MTIQSVTVTINGTEHTLTYNSQSGKYEKTITAPEKSSGGNNSGAGPDIGTEAQGKGYYPVSVTATDTAGNSTTVNDTHATLGQSCRLVVHEKTSPTISITNPTQGSFITTSTPTISLSAYDAGSGIKPDTCKISIDSGSEIAVTLSGSGTSYSGSYTPSALTDGSHTVTAYVYDYDGNKSQVASVTFTIDTIPPSLSVTAPTDNLTTNIAALTVTGTTSDAGGGSVSISIKLNGTDQGAVTVTSGAFSKAITLVEGSNTIIVTATDTAGKTTTVSRTVTLNTTAPTISAVSITPNPADTGATYIIAVTVSD